MKLYDNVKKGVFVSRPNRFIANVEVDGQIKVCHVKNTGRCRELLIEGALVLLEKSSNSARKTEYDLIAVYKGDKLINIDSQAPNKVFGEWVKNSGYFGEATVVKPETTYNSSRFDYYIESESKKIFVEIKGVTLEENGVVLFPDAPTERGIKHLNELVRAVGEGYSAYVFFIVQMEGCKYFTPNVKTHPEFAEALKNAEKNGVNVCCVECKVFEDGFSVTDFLEVRL